MGKNVKKQTYLIDTDMGNDDIVAILWLLLSKNIKISAITTVNGVSSPIVGAQNLNRILDYCKISLPIFVGSTKALKENSIKFPLKDIQRAESLTPLSNVNLLQSNLAKIDNSIEDRIFKLAPKQIIALGPLTNIAKTILKYGIEFTDSVDKLIIMGGGIKKGNVSPLNLAEYNIALDPEAANIVFNSNIKILLIVIDVTRKVPATNELQNLLKKVKTKNKKTQIIKEIIVNNESDFDSFYDPLVSAILLKQTVVTKMRKVGIEVVLKGKNRGQTVLNNRRNVTLVEDIDPKQFYDLLINSITNSSYDMIQI